MRERPFSGAIAIALLNDKTGQLEAGAVLGYTALVF
jgi:hypothetical protein